MTSSNEILDLYEISLLLAYERASVEPRFRHAKLREIASASSPFKTIVAPPQWDNHKTAKDGFVLDIGTPKSISERDGPDLPSNMLPVPTPPSLQHLTAKDVERIYWQIRSYDGCFRCIALLQHFFNLYPPNVALRIRTSTGVDFVTTAFHRSVREMLLLEPKLMTMIMIMPTTVHIGGDLPEMNHSVLEFYDPSRASEPVILDLSSLQFGDVGRVSGTSTFVLESKTNFSARLGRIANDTETPEKPYPRYPRHSDDSWLKPVALKVKTRWDNRQEKRWCGHCGAPGSDLKKCACQEAFYCDGAHQLAAWPFHKRFCAAKIKGVRV
ncbi:hypothetical protein C8R43DRAFT_1005915 [Mycena crocata]|nr:hypothetical protein C8R43DRAFT_1005915 [Mycena crocata]